MSTKFEQLLDLIVNEEMDKANELFHEIVVEKSRDIYENLIAEEEDQQADEAEADADESVDEEEDEEKDPVDESEDEYEESVSEEEDQQDEGYEDTEENMDLEDSFELEGGDDEGPMGGDPADDFGSDAGMGDMGGEGDLDADAEEEVKMDIQAAIDQLQAAFDKMGGGDDMGDMPGDDMDSMGGDDDEKKSDEMMGFSEGRRMTREYREKVGNDWEKNSQKQQGAIVGKNTGEGMPSADNSKSPISSGKGKPTTGATAANILGGKGGQEGGSNTGTSPNKPTKGINPESGEKFTKGVTTNLDGSTTGVKKLSKVAGGHGAEKKGAAPGPVGAGTGDKAGQTSVAPETKKQFLKPFSN